MSARRLRHIIGGWRSFLWDLETVAAFKFDTLGQVAYKPHHWRSEVGGFRSLGGVILLFDIVNEEEMRGRRRANLDAGANAYCDDLRTYERYASHVTRL